MLYEAGLVSPQKTYIHSPTPCNNCTDLDRLRISDVGLAVSGTLDQVNLQLHRMTFTRPKGSYVVPFWGSILESLINDPTRNYMKDSR